jgi:serine/threonine-protein kinase
LEYLIPIFGAVGYAHSKGIVHRDIKPDNILVRDDGKVKLSDFGLARAHDFSTVTATGTALGTPAYMAPEQIEGKPLQMGTDQYALGVMAFQLATGRLPFEGQETTAILIAHLRTQPPAPSSVKPELPEKFDEIVLKMLTKNPAERYHSVRDAKDELLTLLDL